MNKPHVLVARAVFPQVLEKLQQHFEVEHNQDDALWTPAQLHEKLAGKAGVLTMAGVRIDEQALAACPGLRICANMAVGYDNLDLPAMTARRVLATNTPNVLNETTADHGFALLMAIARRITESEHYLRAGRWDRWSYDLFAGSEVHGSTLGILGMGRIGQEIAKRGALGFGMKVIYHNRSRLAPEIEGALKATHVGKEQLLREADHLMLVLPYTPQTRHTIGAAELALMKPTANLINIARGGIVDDAALAKALHARTIAGAALDVFEGEPSVHPDLLTASNVVLTPHIGSATVQTRMAMADLAADNLIGLLVHGKPVTPLNPEVLNAA